MKAQTLLLAALWAACAANLFAIDIASRPIRNLVTTDGFVQVIKEADGIVYIGGRFHKAGTWTGGGVIVNPATADLVPDFPKVNGVVSAVLPDGGGGYFIGGEFTEVGGLVRSNIAHITAQRQVDVNWTAAPGGLVRGLSLYNGILYYIRGSINDYGSATVTKIAAVSAANGSPIPFDVTVNGVVPVILAANNRVYIGGLFVQSSGAQVANLAAYDLNGNLTTWKPLVNEEVRGIAYSGNTLYVSGLFSSSGGKPRNGIAAIDMNTAVTLDWNPAPDGAVTAIAVADGTLYAAGPFVAIAGQNRKNVAAFDTATGALLPFQAENAAFYPIALAVGQDYIAIGGSPNYGYDLTKDLLLVILDRQTGAVRPTPLDPNVTVITAAASINDFYMGGLFSMLKGEERAGGAAFNAQTGELTPWNPKAETNVIALAIASDKVFIGGELNSVAGQPRKYIGAVDRTNGELIQEWFAEPDGAVLDMAVYQDRLYVGGIFRNVGGLAHTNIVALDVNSGAVLPWDPMLNRARVAAVTISGDTLYIGGLLRTVGSVTRTRLAAFNLLTGELTDWAPTLNSSANIEAIEVAGSTVYFGGRFTSVNGLLRTNAAAVTLTGEVLAWAPNPNGNVNDIAVADDKVFLTGDFRNVDGQPRNCVAAVDATAGHVLPWDPNVEYFGTCLTIANNQLYLGGAFFEVFKEVRTGFAGFQLSTVPDEFPELTPGSVMVDRNGIVELQITVGAGISLIPQFSVDLLNWNDLPAIVTQAGVTTIRDDTSSSRPISFYRLKSGK